MWDVNTSKVRNSIGGGAKHTKFGCMPGTGVAPGHTWGLQLWRSGMDGSTAAGQHAAAEGRPAALHRQRPAASQPGAPAHAPAATPLSHCLPSSPLQLLALGKLYNDKSYSSKKPLPGVHPAALAVWNDTARNAPKPAAGGAGGTGATQWWRLPGPAFGPSPPTPGVPDWAAACGACAAARSVDALPTAQQARCRLECGFWSGREMAAVRRSVRELAHGAAARAQAAAAAASGRRLLNGGA